MKTTLCILTCIECGSEFPIQRVRMRDKKHIKHLYCIKCKIETKHIHLEEMEKNKCQI